MEFGKTNLLSRNTPTLLNVIYQKAFFYDGRVYELEDQIMDVVHRKNEMQSSLENIADKLRSSVSVFLKMHLKTVMILRLPLTPYKKPSRNMRKH